MARRLRVGVIYGGRSGEHEISLRSALSVVQALDPGRYEIVPVAITKDGRWLTGPETLQHLERAQHHLDPVVEHGVEVTLPAAPGARGLIPLAGGPSIPLDVVFPVLHGTYGEDGTIQGLLDLAGMPYVGAGVLASATGMDKAIMKSLFRDAGIPVCRWLVVQMMGEQMPPGLTARVAAELGFPCFVKPANLGSSVGISKVRTADELLGAVVEAAAYDPKLVIEEAITGRELEVAVLGNDAPEVSVVGELIPSHDFYDYADKYVAQGARTLIPAPIAPECSETIRTLAARAFRAIDCSGLARVDFFLEPGGRVLVNEINTMPGFTPISMYPKLWEASGLAYPALIDRLIALALERHAARGQRRLSFAPPVAMPPRQRRA
jgi:D-alanine-D-alanine ligase